jgi:RHS repeat-associated protein
VLNEQLHYAFDPAGNLKYRTNNALVANFQVNTLNELTANTNGGRLTVMGTATSQNSTTVTVNSSNALVYGDATFAATNMPLTTTYTAIAADSLGRHSTNTVTVDILTNNTSFQHDGNGNLISDGLRSFSYDDENQLIQVMMTNQWLSQFSYDGKMRRRVRQEYTWQSGAWVQTNEVYYVYDGNVVIQERTANNLPATTYTRGKDLSGSLEGAGGIGGLLSMTLNTQPGPSSSNSYCYHSDGNGNVTMLINASQAVVAKYLYDAFGNILSAAGSFAQQNVYRFSSKEAHLNSGLVYYLYRYYDANLQRWPNRDPIGIGEDGGINLYQFVENNANTFSDSYGMQADPISLPIETIAVGVGIVTVGIVIIVAHPFDPVSYPSFGDSTGTPPGNPIPTSVCETRRNPPPGYMNPGQKEGRWHPQPRGGGPTQKPPTYTPPQIPNRPTSSPPGQQGPWLPPSTPPWPPPAPPATPPWPPGFPPVPPKPISGPIL